MFYVITNGVKIEDAFAQGRYTKFPNLDDARAFADNLKIDTGNQYDVVKVEWVTTTQTLGDLKKAGRA